LNDIPEDSTETDAHTCLLARIANGCFLEYNASAYISLSGLGRLSLIGLIVRIAALAAIVLHLVAGRLPEEAAWSVWPYTVLPASLGWLGALAVASLALSPVNDALGRWLYRLWATLPGKTQRRRWFAAVAVAMAVPFWFFRIRHLRWGDAHFIVKALSYTGPDRPIWTIYNWQSPLAIFIHAQL
jgi:hypothetical protein